MYECDDLDRLIDQALGTYADANPGLERRVLARIAGERRPARHINRLVWLGSLATAACLLLWLALLHRGPAPSPIAGVHNVPALPQTSLISEAPILRAPQQRQKQARQKRTTNGSEKSLAARPPKQEIFPTPRPLSPEERALAQFAAQAPEAEHKSFIDAQSQMDEPIQLAWIQIDDLSIPPLESPQAGTN